MISPNGTLKQYHHPLTASPTHSPSPTSGRMRYAPTVFGRKTGNAHRKSISKHSKSRPSHPRNIGKYVGAQRHTPSRERTMTSIIYEVQLRQHFPLRSHQGVCDTPLQFLAEKRGNAHRKSISKHSKSRSSHPRIIGKYVGAQRHTPSRRRTMTSIIHEVQLHQPIPLRSHQGVCPCAPTVFGRKTGKCTPEKQIEALEKPPIPSTKHW